MKGEKSKMSFNKKKFISLKIGADVLYLVLISSGYTVDWYATLKSIFCDFLKKKICSGNFPYLALVGIFPIGTCVTVEKKSEKSKMSFNKKKFIGLKIGADVLYLVLISSGYTVGWYSTLKSIFCDFLKKKICIGNFPY